MSKMEILISSFCLAGVRLENILNSITDPAQASISLSRVYISFVALFIIEIIPKTQPHQAT